MSTLEPFLSVIGLVSLAAAASYALLALTAVLVWRTRRTPGSGLTMPAVTLLKPLCGAEPGLYQHLRSFCTQQFAEYQIVFGVQHAADPALAVVQQLVAEFPALPIDIVVNPQMHGSNAKVSNLINMLPLARHELLSIVDADTSVGDDYLTTVTAPLLKEDVGLVTCVYRDLPTLGIWSRLGAMYINEWYMPSVLLARLFGHGGYASGQTLCFRRQTLDAIGGFAAISNHMAEDHRLGELIRGLGLRIVLSTVAVTAEHDEPDLQSLTRHELRWMRTIRALRPRSFRWLFLSFSLPLALCATALTLAASGNSMLLGSLLAVALASRLGLHFVHRLDATRSVWTDLWLLPARDLLLCWHWIRSFFSTRVTWQGGEFDIDADGVMHPTS
jgi:ceramide glucosyltransferase